MPIDRRNFIKIIGITAASLAIGRGVKASPEMEENIEFFGVLYDSTRCGGCQGCEYACAQAHNFPLPEDEPQVGVKREPDETRRTVVNHFDSPVGAVFAKKQCMHCNQPACDAACLTKAMHKTMEGPVVWREEKCMGCRYCMISCPFDVPKFEYKSTNPRIIKCDMCYDRLKEGKTPACVEECPAEALVFDTRRNLIKEGRRRIAANPALYVDHIYGEHEAGGTGAIYLAHVPFSSLGFNERIQKESYPSLTKGFISSIAPVDIVLPAMLLGLSEASKLKNKRSQEEQV